MKKMVLMNMAAALALSGTPASAQLLGGGGLGGGLGATLGGGFGGGLGGTLGSLGSSSGGTLRGSGRIEKSVDTRKGRASARGSGAGSLTGSLDGALSGSNGTATGTAAGTASRSGSAGIAAQALGTDAVGATANDLRNGAAIAADGARAAAGAAVSQAGAHTSHGSSASGNAAGSGSAGASAGMLSGAGAITGSAQGAANVVPGMNVRDTAGRAVGKVRDVRTTAEGTVQAVLVQVGERTATLPAGNFEASGDVLVSSMTQADVRKAATSQAQGTNGATSTN